MAKIRLKVEINKVPPETMAMINDAKAVMFIAKGFLSEMRKPEKQRYRHTYELQASEALHSAARIAGKIAETSDLDLKYAAQSAERQLDRLGRRIKAGKGVTDSSGKAMEERIPSHVKRHIRLMEMHRSNVHTGGGHMI